VDTCREAREVESMEASRRVSARRRRRFTDEFKAGAVRLVLEEGRSIGEIARELDVVPSALGNWVKKAKIDAGRGPVGSVTSSEREELARLRREVRHLRMERDILKKAAAFFAKEST
jgi:transposase